MSSLENIFMYIAAGNSFKNINEFSWKIFLFLHKQIKMLKKSLNQTTPTKINQKKKQSNIDQKTKQSFLDQNTNQSMLEPIFRKNESVVKV